MGSSQTKSAAVKKDVKQQMQSDKPTLLGAEEKHGKANDDPSLSLSKRASRTLEDALYIVFASTSADGEPWASPVAFWATDKGVCFATPASSTKVANLRNNSTCSFTAFDSKAAFMTGFGVQASGNAVIVEDAEWSIARRGIRARFPNLESDAVGLHEGLFKSMQYVLIEVTVDTVHCNCFDPVNGDHRVEANIRWQELQMAPFSTEKHLGPPPMPPTDPLPTRARAVIEESLYASFVSASSVSNEPWASAVAFWPTAQGICFATPASSLKVTNVQNNSKCSFAIFNSHAPFMAGFGMQASGRAAVVDSANVRSALKGIRQRFPNVEGDVVEMHAGMFDAMKYVLVEVVVEHAFVNGFDPERGGDCRMSLNIPWGDLCMKPFSEGTCLGAPRAAQ